MFTAGVRFGGCNQQLFQLFWPTLYTSSQTSYWLRPPKCTHYVKEQSHQTQMWIERSVLHVGSQGAAMLRFHCNQIEAGIAK